MLNHDRCFDKSGADCLSRPQPLDPPGLSLFQEAVALTMASRLGHGGGSLIYSDFEGFASSISNGAAYKHHVFEKVGYVDEIFDACEDVEFNFRVEKANLRTFMSPKVQVKYYPRKNLKALFRQMVRYGIGRYRLFRKHPERIQFGTILPPVFSITVLTFLPSAIFTIMGLLPYWLSLLPFFALMLYAVAIILQFTFLVTKANFCYIGILPSIFFVIHFGLGLGFIRGAITRPAK